MKIPLSILLMLLVVTYIAGVVGNPFIFVISVFIAFIAFWPVVFWAVVTFIVGLKSRPLRILTCLIFFLFGGWLINRYCLPYRFHPISITGNAGILFFTIFLGWCLLRQRRIKTLIAGATMFVLFIYALKVFSLYAYADIGLSFTDALKSLPYLGYVVEDKAIEKNGVVIYKKDLCSEGINIYHPHLRGRAYLMDMSGRLLHKWRPEEFNCCWHYVRMCDDGDLIVIVKDSVFMRLGWDSDIKWVKKTRGAKKIRAHHEAAIGQNKNIYVLDRRDEIVLRYGLPVLLLNEYILEVSPNGEIKRAISFYELLKDEMSASRIFKTYGWMVNPQNVIRMIQRVKKGKREDIGLAWTPSDFFHINTLKLIDKDNNEIFKKGSILFCSREISLIGAIDIERKKLLWSWGKKELQQPHYPELLGNGNILIFDNGNERKYSRVIELNPLTEEIVWEYKADPPESFYVHWGGTNQALPNGNILITDSTHGRVFELTRDKEIVWEFYNPLRDKEGKRVTIYRMQRIVDLDKYPGLKGLKEN